MLEGDYRLWLYMHKGDLARWMNQNLNIASYPDFKRFLRDFPYVAHLVMKQYGKSVEDKENDIIAKLLKRGCLTLIIGSRGSGKTALAFYLASLLKIAGEKVWWFGPPCALPEFIDGSTMDFDKLPENCTTIVDEASVQFFSRASGEQIDIIRRLPVIRHSGRNFIFITQHTNLSDIQFVRLADVLIYKTQAVLQSKTERVKLSDEMKLFMPNRKDEYLWLDNEDIYTMNFILPYWWKEEYSTPYAPFRSTDEVYRFVITSCKDITDREIVKQLSFKGTEMEPHQISFIRMLVKSYGEDAMLSMDKNLRKELVESGFDDTSINELYAGKRSTGKRSDFKMSPIEEETTNRWLHDSPERDLLSKRKVNDLVLNDIESRLKGYRNIIISIEGETGSGKSLAGESLAEMMASIMNKKFSPENSCYGSEELLEKGRAAISNDVLIHDEQSVGGGFGTGAGRSEEELTIFEETIRKKKISLVYISPRTKTHLHTFVLKTWGIDVKSNKTRLLVFTPDRQLLGYIIVSRPSRPVEDACEKKKDAFLEGFMTGRFAEKRFEETAREIMESEEFLRYSPKKKRHIEALVQKLKPNLGSGEIERVTSWIEMIVKGEE